jgi:hypothetical protein
MHVKMKIHSALDDELATLRWKNGRPRIAKESAFDVARTSCPCFEHASAGSRSCFTAVGTIDRYQRRESIHPAGHRANHKRGRCKDCETSPAGSPAWHTDNRPPEADHIDAPDLPGWHVQSMRRWLRQLPLRWLRFVDRHPPNRR